MRKWTVHIELKMTGVEGETAYGAISNALRNLDNSDPESIRVIEERPGAFENETYDGKA